MMDTAREETRLRKIKLPFQVDFPLYQYLINT